MILFLSTSHPKTQSVDLVQKLAILIGPNVQTISPIRNLDHSRIRPLVRKLSECQQPGTYVPIYRVSTISRDDNKRNNSGDVGY